MEFHGIKQREKPTSLTASVSTSNLATFVGISAINRAKEPSVNKPKLIYTLEEYYKYFGYIGDYENLTLDEAADVFFKFFNVAPIVCINVLDPSKHKKTITNETAIMIGDNLEILTPEIILSSLVVKSSDGITTYSDGLDYLKSFTNNGFEISLLPSGSITENSVLKLTYDVIDPSQVTVADGIGGYDITTGEATGMELFNSIFTMFRTPPTMLLAPQFGEDPAAAAVLDAKADKLNEVFECISIVDVDKSITDYTKVPEHKNMKNIVSPNQFLLWPRASISDKTIRLATMAAAVMYKVDEDNEGRPIESPSNKNFVMDSTVVYKDGQYKPFNLNLNQANYLNRNGIATALNFIGGWKLWGNRTAAYPGITDVKDVFISCKRAMQYYGNEFILSNWANLDKPQTPRLVKNTINKTNVHLNGEVSKGYLLDGKLRFIETNNPKTDLINGKSQYDLEITPPVPNEYVIINKSFNPDALSRLFK